MTSRLVGAFVTVALAAVAVLAVLTFLASREEVDALVERQNAMTLRTVAGEVEAAFVENGSRWPGVDLRPARVLAAAADATMTVTDPAGDRVTGSPAPGGGPGRGGTLVPSGPVGPPLTREIAVAGDAVGTLEMRFPLARPEPERQVLTALLRTVVWGTAGAALVAAVAGVLAAMWLRRPVRRLTDTACAMAAGNRAARTGLADAPAELGTLARAFDHMADTIEREDALRRTMVADVAHELRTPLTIARGELEALVDGVVDPTPERLSSVHDEILRLGRLVDDLGTLSAADAAGLRLERVPVDLLEIASRATDALRPIADAAAVGLDVVGVPARATGDPARLEQAVRNLVVNAIRFTPEGGRITVEVRGEPGASIVSVRDTGPGIPADELDRVFERFWRGRGAAGTEGSGIGLAVVAALAQAHGGTVAAAAAPGGGAAITLTLPRG